MGRAAGSPMARQPLSNTLGKTRMAASAGEPNNRTGEDDLKMPDSSLEPQVFRLRRIGEI